MVSAVDLAAADKASMPSTPLQGLTIVHFPAQRKHILLDTLAA
jgi:hypothetical protein